MNQEPPVRDNYIQSVLRGSFLVVSLLMIVCVGGCTILLYPNQGPQPEPETLLLEASDFPEGWTVGDVFPHRVGDNNLITYDGALVWSYAPTPSRPRQSPPTGIQTIYSYTSFFEAHLDFLWQSEAWFESENYSEWQTPNPINAPSTVADEYKFGCAAYATDTAEMSSDTEICVMVARYGQYLSEFQINSEGTTVSETDIENILTAIDQRFIEMGVK